MILISIERALEKVRLQRELKGYVETLEQRVAERTRDLEATTRNCTLPWRSCRPPRSA